MKDRLCETIAMEGTFYLGRNFFFRGITKEGLLVLRETDAFL
jgi:hypothetical protein